MLHRITLTLLVILTLCPHLQAQPSFDEETVAAFRALEEQAFEAYSKQDWSGCVDAYTKQREIYDGNENSLYNLACCYALQGKSDQAMEALGAAVAAGFWQPGHLESDPDLESIREQEGFSTQVEEAKRLRTAAAAQDPLAGPSDGGGPHESLDDIKASFDARYQDLQKLRGFLGSPDYKRQQASIIRDQAAALTDYAESHPSEAEDAQLAALKAMTDLRSPSPTLDLAIEAFLESHGDRPEAAQVMMLRAEAAAAPYTPAFDEESYMKLHQIMVDASREIVERYPEAEGTRDAYLWLYRDAMQQEDRETAELHYRKLKELWGSDQEFWAMNSHYFFEFRISEEGVPDFDVVAVDGQGLSRSGLEGRVVLLDFWATWCKPCVAELPHLKETYQEFHDDGFDIVGISADDESNISKEDFQAWVKEHEMPWPQYYQPTYAENEMLSIFQVNAFPTTILLDRDGQIAAINPRGDELKAKVAELIGPAPEATK